LFLGISSPELPEKNDGHERFPMAGSGLA
jgi:hypothetical protein